MDSEYEISFPKGAPLSLLNDFADCFTARNFNVVIDNRPILALYAKQDQNGHRCAINLSKKDFDFDFVISFHDGKLVLSFCSNHMSLNEHVVIEYVVNILQKINLIYSIKELT